ncbi:MAG: D-alanyl-D-alanine carboxypeptidase [Clostridia bacterium]|nr:D-alanyl-D-alanine carboxypeptidase [Clostridia bacterium]
MKKIIWILFLLFPIVSFADTTPSISGYHAIVIERNSHRILYEKKAFDKAYIASTTKIMTCIVALENNDLNSVVKVSKKAAGTGGSDVGLKENDEIALSELLYGLMLRSGNDAAVAIAEHTAGSVEEFANLMNQKAVELGALSTHFVTPHGLDTDNHYSTAYDMALIADYALHNETFQKLVSTTFYTMTFKNGKTKELKNTNPLLFSYPGITGVKTGYTGLAGRCLVASAKQNGMELIAITFGEPSSKLRIADTTKLLNYCFSNYSLCNITELYPAQFSVPVKKSLEKTILPIYESDLILPLTEKEKQNLTIQTYLPDEVNAPVEVNQEIGKIQFLLNDEILGELNLLCPRNIKKKTTKDYYFSILTEFLNYSDYLY